MYPAALAVAQEVGASGEEFIAACVVGYEVGCRVGEYLGKSHYEVSFTLLFHLPHLLLSLSNYE